MKVALSPFSMAKKKKMKKTVRTKRKARKTVKRRPTKRRKAAKRKAGPKKKHVASKKKKTKSRKSKKARASKRAATRAIATAKEKSLGKVVHYYDRIGVAIVDLKFPMSVGDFVKLKRGDEEVLQRVDSMQINHAQVAAAKKGDVVGIKVTQPVHEGAMVLPV